MKLLVPLSLFLSATLAGAQGGPPLLTDDPGTPGSGNWEINSAWQAIASRASLVSLLPQFDINYGAGDHIQLNLQAGYAFVNVYGEGTSSGLSSFSAASKWRFVDEERAGVSVSTYPRVDFHDPFSSRNENINAPGTRFFLPIEFSKQFGRFGLNPEIGYAHFTRQSDEWDFGFAFSFEVHKERELLAEIHGRRILNDGGTETLPQIGSRWAISRLVSAIGAVGRSISVAAGGALFWSFYFGAQLRL